MPPGVSVTSLSGAITAKRSFATSKTELDISRSFLFTARTNLSICFPIVYWATTFIYCWRPPKAISPKLMQALQTSYTVSFNKRHRRSGHVFEQRYKALLVDKDNYLLQVSRYIHLNPVSARIVSRPQDYRWSSYGSYLKGKGIGGLKPEKVLGYFAGDRKKQLAQYREYVEGVIGERQQRYEEPMATKQMFIGDAEFIDKARQRSATAAVRDGHYSLKRIVGAVSEVMRIDEEDLKRPGRREGRTAEPGAHQLHSAAPQ